MKKTYRRLYSMWFWPMRFWSPKRRSKHSFVRPKLPDRRHFPQPPPGEESQSDSSKQPKVALLRGTYCVLFAVLVVSQLSAKVEAADEAAVVVWSEVIGEDHEIYGSFADGKNWHDAVRLISAKDNDILACAMLLETDDQALVVWTRLVSFEESYLTWLIWKRGEKPGKSMTFDTGLTVNTGVSMVKDKAGAIWLSWAGYDGSDDDIYIAKWRGDGWSEPKQVNVQDDLPDISANLGLSEDDTPWISWHGLDAKGYRRYFSRYDGADWTEELPLSKAKEKDFELLMKKRLGDLPSLPVEIEEPGKACMTYMDGHTLQVLRYPPPDPKPGPQQSRDSGLPESNE